MDVYILFYGNQRRFFCSTGKFSASSDKPLPASTAQRNVLPAEASPSSAVAAAAAVGVATSSAGVKMTNVLKETAKRLGQSDDVLDAGVDQSPSPLPAALPSAGQVTEFFLPSCFFHDFMKVTSFCQPQWNSSSSSLRFILRTSHISRLLKVLIVSTYD